MRVEFLVWTVSVERAGRGKSCRGTVEQRIIFDLSREAGWWEIEQATNGFVNTRGNDSLEVSRAPGNFSRPQPRRRVVPAAFWWVCYASTNGNAPEQPEFYDTERTWELQQTEFGFTLARGADWLFIGRVAGCLVVHQDRARLFPTEGWSVQQHSFASTP